MSSAAGKHLVIVESPAKAKTINRYLGGDFVVHASIGHIRDLPSKAPKGSKQEVPGVDLENNFAPTYVILPEKKDVVNRLKKAAKEAIDVWFATDWDREGEAIAWHLAQELEIPLENAKRVVFNAITKGEIERAFQHPHRINEDMVNAQQARRILDRIVGYQVSPLLWKKVARGLSAGRVQSVAVRLIVEREREIRGFVPDEEWSITAYLALTEQAAEELAPAWQKFLTQKDEKGKSPTLKAQNEWLTKKKAIRVDLVTVAGKKFEPALRADEIVGPLKELTAEAIRSRLDLAANLFSTPQAYDISGQVAEVALACGLGDLVIAVTEEPDGRGPARWVRTIQGRVDPVARYAVDSIETKRTRSRPQAPFITSSLQMAASSALGFGAKRTMRLAQQLYEGVDVTGIGRLGLITYMRTDSTHVSPEAMSQARTYIKESFGNEYLPSKPRLYESSNKAAQEAHEAIRPTDVTLTPQKLHGKISDNDYKLYQLIWNRFVACQMTDAEWDTTTIRLERSDKPTGAVLRTSGRILVFDGFYRVTGIPTSSDEQTLPELTDQQTLAPFDIQPQQVFTNPPPRYTEASLVKTLESEGIGRPSTYAQIIQVIQDRGYVEQVDRRFHATDLGEVVTDKLIEGFPRLMDVGYTRQMEDKLDQIEEQHKDWISMLSEFYERFSSSLAKAHELMTHAKAETQPAPYKCPECGSRTVYRFGKNGRFLSCGSYPKCNYAAPIDREGRPHLPERVNVACPEDGSPMILRTGRYGKFLASANYPEVKCVINLDKRGRIKYPAPPPLQTDVKCNVCGAPLNLRRGKRGPWLGCSTFPKCRGRLAWNKLDPSTQRDLQRRLEQHEQANPLSEIHTVDGRVIPEGTLVTELTIPGEVQELEIHPGAAAERPEAA